MAVRARLVIPLVTVFTALLATSWPGVDIDAARPLQDRVEIRRDTFGVPHILAETEESAAFALGYAEVEDHPVALARWLLSARGEAARYFGPELLNDDIAAIRLRNSEQAREGLKQLDGTFRRMVEAFASGINFFVSTHRSDVPSWMPVFTAVDVLAGTRDDAVSAVSSPGLVRALRAKYPDEVPAETVRSARVAAIDAGNLREPGAAIADERKGGARSPSAPPAGVSGFVETTRFDAPGSNALAIAGSRTTSGAPILLGNPHLSWRTRYWEAHITVPERLDFYGSTLIGYPWLRAGFNARLAYVQTNNGPDLEDVFALSIDPAAPDHYVFDGKSRPLVRRDLTIQVKQPDGTLRGEARTFWDSHLGPVIYRTRDKAFAVDSSRANAWRYFEGFWRLSRARTLGDFMSVMRKGFIPQSNFTYADAEGNIFYLWNARLPKRVEDGTSYDLEVPASTRKYVWERMHPLSDLPQLLNPHGGYIQNANNAPWYTSLRDPIDPARYPSYVERRDLGLRPQAALRMLETRDRFSPEDVKALKYSTRMLLAERVKPDLLAAIDRAGQVSDALASARDVLRDWDNQVSATSVGAVLFQRFWDRYSAEVWQPFAEPWDAKRPVETPRGLADPVAALRHLEDAVAWTRDTLGSERVAWGDVHRFQFGALDLPGDGASGNYGLYRVVTFASIPGGKRVAGLPVGAPDLLGFGDAWVLLVHFARPLQAQSVLAYGQSTRAGSSHTADQIRIFANHDLRPAWFGEAEIAAHTERRYRPGE